MLLSLTVGGVVDARSRLGAMEETLATRDWRRVRLWDEPNEHMRVLTGWQGDHQAGGLGHSGGCGRCALEASSVLATPGTSGARIRLAGLEIAARPLKPRSVPAPPGLGGS